MTKKVVCNNLCHILHFVIEDDKGEVGRVRKGYFFYDGNGRHMLMKMYFNLTSHLFSEQVVSNAISSNVSILRAEWGKNDKLVFE